MVNTIPEATWKVNVHSTPQPAYQLISAGRCEAEQGDLESWMDSIQIIHTVMLPYIYTCALFDNLFVYYHRCLTFWHCIEDAHNDLHKCQQRH